MKHYLAKLRHILPVYLLVSTGTVAALLAIRYVFSIATNILDINEELWELWLPLVLPSIPVLIWLRPKFKILKPAKNGRTWSDFFIMIVWLTISGSMIASQIYIGTATGKLTKVRNVQEMELAEASRYYTIDKYGVASYLTGVHFTAEVSGKHNEYLHYKLYFAAPILNDTNATKFEIPLLPKTWFGVFFRKDISNKLSIKEKEKAYEDFYNACVEKYKRYNFRDLDYLERVPQSNDKDAYLIAIQKVIKNIQKKDVIIMRPIHGHFENRNGNKLFWIFGFLGIGLIIFLTFIAIPNLDTRELARQKAGIKSKDDDFILMLKYLIPRGNHFATSIIIDINIVVFLIMILSGVGMISIQAVELFKWGGSRSYEVFHGQLWRLITSMFIHGGIMHLMLNIFGLFLASIFIEPILGRKNYFILYLMSGICGGLTSAWWHENVNLVSVGASGAIFGLYGAILCLVLTKAYPKGTKYAALYIIGIQALVSLLWGFTGGIDNAAHIGGLLSGAVIGFVLYKLSGNSIDME